MSLLNWGGGLSAMGSSIADFAGKAGLTAQKAEQDRALAELTDQLATTRETTLAHVQGAETRDTAVTSAGAQGAETRTTQEAANKLPMTEAQKAEDKTRKDTLAETRTYHEGELNKPVAAGYNGAFVKDTSTPDGWKHIAGEGSFTPEMSSLMGALAERGVSLPAGLRSRQQQASLYQGLMDRNPGKTPDEIADGIKAGQIEFGAQKKMTQVAAGMAGKVSYAEHALSESIPVIREQAALVDRGQFVTINKLLQMKDTEISDPALKKLKIYIMGAMNDYDVLGGRGGTDVEKRNEAHKLLTSADSPEALEAGLDAFEVEVAIAKRAAKAAMRLEPREAAPGTGGTGAPAAAPAAAKPPPAAGAPKTALPGTLLGKTPDGKDVIAGPDGKPHVREEP